MKTTVGLASSNCSWCLNAMAERLAAQPLVRNVHVNAAAGCLEVDHDHDNPEALVAKIHDDLRGWATADNGEAVMVELDVQEESACLLAASPASQVNLDGGPTDHHRCRGGSWRSCRRTAPCAHRWTSAVRCFRWTTTTGWCSTTRPTSVTFQSSSWPFCLTTALIRRPVTFVGTIRIQRTESSVRQRTWRCRARRGLGG